MGEREREAKFENSQRMIRLSWNNYVKRLCIIRANLSFWRHISIRFRVKYELACWSSKILQS